MSPEQNELITRIGPGTKCGALMRHYWHPVALADELPAERPAKAVRVLGQNFVLFRDERGRHGLLDRDCPHRGADLAFGRLEDGGLRFAPVRGGATDLDGRVQILEGVNMGESVVVYSHRALKAGSRIKVVERLPGVPQ